MAKTSQSLTDITAGPVDILRREMHSPLERAMRDAGLTIPGRSIGIARDQVGLMSSPGLSSASITERLRSPYRRFLDEIAASLGQGTGTSRRSATPIAPAEEELRSVAQIGARVRAARRAMNMTQQQFADLAGVGRRFLVELEKGKKSLEIDRVLAVCRAAGIKLRFA